MKKTTMTTKLRRARRAFTAQEKADAVRMVKAGKTAAQVARELDLTLTSLQAWVKQADADAGRRTDILTTEEREELARLRRENKRLQMERDILKAAATFFAKENA
jgi:transposase-like protein